MVADMLVFPANVEDDPPFSSLLTMSYTSLSFLPSLSLSLFPGGQGGVCATAAQAEGGAGEAGGSLRVHVHQQTPQQPQL